MRKVAHAYAYCDEQGELLFEACRFADGMEPKCQPRRPARESDPVDKVFAADGGRWVWEADFGIETDGVRPGLLYGLDRVLDDSRRGEPVCIVEGEPDVDALEFLGFIAVTNAFGASWWTPQHSKWLAGRRCVIVEDNDDAGRKRTETVFGSLALAGAASIRVVRFADCPPKTDVSDWLGIPKPWLPGGAEFWSDRSKVPALKSKFVARVQASRLWQPAPAE